MSDKFIINQYGAVEPIEDLFKWSAWFEKGRKRYQKATQIGNVRVSTIFLALDHGFIGYSESAPPILWETMIFDDSKVNRTDDIATFPEELGQWRFETMKQARQFHNKKVRQLKRERQQEQMNIR